MYLLPHLFLLLLAISFCKGGYGVDNETPQSDVDAPAYVPAYLKHQKTARGPYGTKTSYYGTKTSYSGTKSGYSGSKTSYRSRSYTGTKSWPTKTGSVAHYEDFQESANRQYTQVCEPPCQNAGICVDGTTCHCPPDYRGNYCEFRKTPCLTHPPLPMNSERKCSAEFCTITCVPGHKFPDGSTVTNMRCADNGQWVMTRADLSGLSDCMPVCEPPCLHGGVCLSANQCQCPPDRRGPQCQYSASACNAAKLSFNGGYRCHGDGESFSCSVTCPDGSTFISPPAAEYTCHYSTGVFEPQPLPRCVLEEIIIVTPSNYHHASEVEDMMQSVNVSHSETHHSVSQVIVQDFTPQAGTCISWAGTHYKTFDGKIYSFKSPCQHILLRDVDKTLMVALKHQKCKGRPTCPAELTFFVGDKEYVLSLDEDGSVVFRSSRRLIPVPARLPGISVVQRGSSVSITLLEAATVLWDTDNVILIEASAVLWNRTAGLCGTLDGVPETDFRAPGGAPAKSQASFAAAWQTNRIGDICDSSPSNANSCAGKPEDLKREAKQFCTRVFSHSKFRKCSSVLNVLSLMETCQWDYCSGSETLSSEESACATVAVYAKECLRRNVDEMKNWRDADTCPMQCPDGKIYKTCGPESQPSCAFPELPTKATNETCVEGCFCPEGLLLEGGKCLPKDRCPCRLRNRSFEPGQTVTKDCNTCKCQSGEWTCTQVPCGARCGAIGDPHYTTFDGLQYDFMGRCSYYLLRTKNVTVEVENVACSASESEFQKTAHSAQAVGKPSCTKSVTIRHARVTIQLKQAGEILVGGKEVMSLPVTAGDIIIRAASSLFVIVQLPNGIDVWWDGKTRAYVDVPPTFHGKTKGLCGTFNLNQKDDFLTSEGDVEQSAFAFANKWKTRELCSDVSTKEPEHPCEANVVNKEAAEKYCSRLKSKLFEPCHWYVDPEPSYQACLFDMCACAGAVPRCLCPVLGDYAGRCARAGVKLQWRYNVKECELSCTGGQEYTVCADSCSRTCADVAVASTRPCRPSCVEGCACVAGQVLDETNTCVPVAQCACYHKGIEFKAGYKEVRPGRRERELCTCVGAKWECVPATPSDIKAYPPAEDIRSNCSASKHMEFTTCETAEPLTCKNMHLPPSSTSSECRPGCQCQRGFVLDVTSRTCVQPTQCPCHHGSRSYLDGETITEECNTCTCASGNWSCTERACVGACVAWGDSHVVTYDGAQYDFEGVCGYVLAKGCMEAGLDGFQVTIQNVPCGTTGATCSKSVALTVGGGGGPEEVVELTKDTPLPDVSAMTRIKLREAGAFVYLDVPSLGVTLQWDRGMRVNVRVDAMWKNRVKGLCGNFNGDMRDDFQTPSGGDIAETSALIFADSWKLKPTCPKTEAVRDHCQQRPERHPWAVTTCGALKRHPFSLCHTEVPPGPWVERCERDACACDSGDDCACACTALATYAQLCASRGVIVKWRTQQLCPMQCDEECSNYDPCISPCPAETCDNTLYYEEIKASCKKDTCVEGCKPKTTCPEGSVYTNSTAKVCVPRVTCKPVCMQVDGRVVLEGELLEQDACHTCTCSRGKRACTGQPCSTEPTPLSSSPPPTLDPPPKLHDEQLKCVTGWSQWVNQDAPAYNALNQSVEAEPLPQAKRFPIGSPMCNSSKMQKIECRTVADHKFSKDTGLDVECSLERGLLCKEIRGKCPDFEIRVYCQCDEEPFQCLNSTRPSYAHPTNCAQFYECTPGASVADVPHAVLKSCSEGLMYNPRTMVCDWPAAVEPLRPECRNTTEQSTEFFTGTTPTVFTWATATLPTTTPRVCPARQVYKECAFPCDKLCDHFKKTVLAKGLCSPGQKCIEGCVDETVASAKCDVGSLWRDEKTCVPIKDCTCFSDGGNIVKPGGVTAEGCIKCQCLDNAMHCDSSECVSPGPPAPGPTHQAIVLTPTTGAPTTPGPLIVVTTSSPPPLCPDNRYVNLLDTLPDSAFSASSVLSELFSPQYAKLDAHPIDINAGSWSPVTHDQNQYIQVSFERREPLYGVLMQGSPLYDQYVTSYELMYGDQPGVFETLKDADGKPRTLRGPVDHNNAVKQMFNPPIEAKYVRIRPITWHDEISVRFDLIGCQEDVTPMEAATEATTVATTTVSLSTSTPAHCVDQLGLGGGLPVEHIEVSSNSDERRLLSLGGDEGWTPLYSTPGEWILFDFESPRQITGVKTAGGKRGYVTSYHVMYASDLSLFSPVLDKDGTIAAFPANHDGSSVALNEFALPIHARYFKILPVKWQDSIEMRIEPLGCFEPYTVSQSTPRPTVAHCVDQLGLGGGLPVEHIEVSSNSDERRLLSLGGDEGWTPLYSTPGEWILFDFESPRQITGVKTAGGKRGYVTSYHVMYASDLSLFSPVLDKDGKIAEFPANHDGSSVALNEFALPIHARYFKILPVKWQDSIEMRIEPLGCFEPYKVSQSTPRPTVAHCVDQLGLGGGLPVEHIEVSSNSDERRLLSMGGVEGWTPLYSTPGEWILFDFESPRQITGVKTAGGKRGYVTSYHVMYASDLSLFSPVLDKDGKIAEFPANHDGSSVALNEFALPIHARYFKILPVKWQDSIEMRIEPLGCFEPYKATTPTFDLGQTTTNGPATIDDCTLCPGALAPSGGECYCKEKQFYDGENCVSRDQCPCFVGFMSYAVGASFRGTNCDECVCKLGGITNCQPVNECQCQPDLVPKQSNLTCACTCEPCPPGTKICPTNRLCLSLDKWCDGLQDCPDDERACTTVGTVPPTRGTVITTLEPLVVTTLAPTLAAVVTTPKPLDCPKAECPKGYLVHFITGAAAKHRYTGTDLPPPRPRLSYQRYYKGGRGGTKSYGGYKGAKGGFSKGGYSAYQPPKINQDFTLDAPPVEQPKKAAQECAQFKCVPKLPPYKPGVRPPPCATPQCPPHYSLKLEAVATRGECPQYVCVPPPERPVFCNVTGRTISTFDGSEYKYDVCFHILARDAGADGAWTVLVRKKCRVDSCRNELLIRQDDQLILIKPDLMIEYNNYEYTVEQTSMICFQKNSFDLYRLGDGVVVKSRSYNFTVLFNTQGDVKIGVSKSYLNSVDGLCGFFDGDASNDRRLPNGRSSVSVEKFGEGWAKPGLPPTACQTTVVPPEIQKRRWDLCGVVAQEPLSRCGKVLNLDKWRNICLEKICECTEVIVNGTKRTEEQCRCSLLEQFVAECLAADKDIELDWRTPMNCPASCPAPLVHYDCYRRSCEPQCSTLGVGRRCESQSGQCSPGCYCPEGTLRQGSGCVAPQNCLDCACNVAGTRYTTFERDALPLGGNCTYLATRDRNETGHHAYQVYATNGACEDNSDTICTKAVHLIHGSNVIRVEQNSLDKKLKVIMDGAVVFDYPMRKEGVTVKLFNGEDIIIALMHAHVAIKVQPTMEFEVRVASHLYSNATEGLCGVCAGYLEHLLTSHGNLTDDLDEYGKSWQAKGDVLTTLQVPLQEQCDEPEEKECIPPPPEKNACYNIMNLEKFGACHALVDPAPYIESCSSDICAGAADPCATLQRYAAECRRLGTCLTWRGDALCPYQRCESPLVYRPCMGCELTCDNYDEMSDVSCDKSLAEGCYCPEGKVRVNNTCIEPTKCFPCDANKEHYAGEQWQKDACTKCTCSKLPKENAAHVSCVTQTCTKPVCAENEDLKTKPAKPGDCCQEYVCVAQPKHIHCEEPKQIDCGFGQVLKQKTKSDGCMEFTCECKPASECEPLPSDNEVPQLEDGMEMVRDDSGCCPRVSPQCRPATCPAAPSCAAPRELLAKNVSTCCLKYECVIPKDTCLVTLEWESSMKGGEVARTTPEQVLKNLDEAWQDGPCRSCRCVLPPSGGAPAAACAALQCSEPASEQYVLQPRPVPLACCPQYTRAACRYNQRVYQPGETWQSEDAPCNTYECKTLDGDLQLVTNVQACHDDCQPGWQYVPPAEGVCCGKCKPVACVVDGANHKVGAQWVSDDFCTNYTCVDVNGTLQVQSANETCPEISEAMKSEFVLDEVIVPGKCCKAREPVACRVGNVTYQEGQTWRTSDPCTNTTCARDSTGRLSHIPRIESCVRDCPLAWRYRPPAPGVCCGVCEQDACLHEEEVKEVGSTWQSPDNCTSFTCARAGDSAVVTSSRELCPALGACAPHLLYTDGCCQRCRLETLDQKPETCRPTPLPNDESVGIIRVRHRTRGLCVNARPLPSFKECRGACVSGTLYNNHTGSHDTKCECCQVRRYEPLEVTLLCDDGTELPHQVGSPAQCDCRACGESPALFGTNSGSKTGTKTGHANKYEMYGEIPDMYRRFGESNE